mgnify:CR=1 FL=1|jgi:hypothetical protein
MKEKVTDYLHSINLDNLEHHDMFISLHTTDEYELALETLKEWIIDGSENHIDSSSHHDIENLVPASLAFSSWILTRILKTGNNDIIFNRIKIKLILKELGLIKKVNIQSYSDFIFTGLGMCITHLSNTLKLSNEQSCKLLISTLLIALEQSLDRKHPKAAA